MNMQDPQAQPKQPQGKTIDLQGVAAFAGLVDLLAQELGSSAGKMQGHLPNGPAFNELIGEIDLHNQGFQRKLTVLTRPKAPITLRFHVSWQDGRKGDSAAAGGI